MKRRKIMRTTRKTKSTKGNSGKTKAERWAVPKGLMLIPVKSVLLINKSMKALGDAVAYGAMAAEISVPGSKKKSGRISV